MALRSLASLAWRAALLTFLAFKSFLKQFSSLASEYSLNMSGQVDPVS